jgi:hypothetical protein
MPSTHEVPVVTAEILTHLEADQFSQVFPVANIGFDPDVSHGQRLEDTQGRQWERYTSHPNANQGPSQRNTPFLAVYGDPLNTALLGKDGYGYSMAGYQHLKELETIRSNGVRLRGQQKHYAALVSEIISREMDESYGDVVAGDVTWLNAVVAASNFDLFVGFSPYSAKKTTRMAAVAGFRVKEEAMSGMLRPHVIVRDEAGERGFLPTGFQLDGLFLLAKK